MTSGVSVVNVSYLEDDTKFILFENDTYDVGTEDAYGYSQIESKLKVIPFKSEKELCDYIKENSTRLRSYKIYKVQPVEVEIGVSIKTRG